MSLRSPYRVLDDIAREYGAKDIDLLPEVIAGVNAKKRTTMKFTTRRAADVVLIVLMVLIIVISAPAAVTAMKRLLGFIPDVGVVEESTPLRTLAEPVSLTRDEITVTVEQAVADSEHTLVNYKVESLPVTAYSDDKNQSPDCVMLPILRLPDGKELEGSGAGDSWATGYRQQISYPALPADVQEAVLYLPCLLQTKRGSTPEDWEIPLKFVAAQPGVDLTVYPLIDVATPTYQPLSTEAASQSEAGGFQQPVDISLHLDQYVQMEDGFILYGRLQWDDADISIDLVDSTAVHLWDSGGQEIALQEYYTAGDGSHTVDGEYSLVYKTAGIYAAGEAVFQIDKVIISKDVNTSFIFDLGAQPQPGQTWRLDQVLHIDGQTLRIESVSLNDTADSLTFMMDSESGISSAVLGDYEHAMLGGGGGAGSAGFTYAGGLPQGAITVTVSNISLELAGPWSTPLDLPLTSLEFTATPPPPHVCITEETWRNALNRAQPGIPDDLTGIISISSLSAPDYIYKVMVADVSGSSRIVAEGDSPSLSPDGLSLVYDAADGLVVMDVATGAAGTLPGTSKRDLNPLWSPDGRYIAFNRGPASGLIGAPGAYDLMLMNTDGTGMRQLTSGDDANYIQEWMPDGKHILYTVAGENGAEIKMMDVAGGEISALFEVNYRNTGIAVSPDGKSIAYEEMLPGEHYAISLANLDGSNRRLLADGYPMVITNMAWSPDGQWLAVTVQDTAETDYKLSLALLHIDTCRIIPLPDIEGYPSSWVR